VAGLGGTLAPAVDIGNVVNSRNDWDDDKLNNLNFAQYKF
tara:strand:- start:682 stop:801 length:120 start_codon:yes stop_codon:yes gene_type:complete